VVKLDIVGYYIQLLENFDKPLISTNYLYTLYKPFTNKWGLKNPFYIIYIVNIFLLDNLVPFHALALDRDRKFLRVLSS
jgi:hypothetical protein